MAYTVKQVAAMSGVSVRTLHFYDETGLLKPAFTKANGYRFYEQDELLRLQQILFYRELGLELKQIKRILGRRNFEIAAALGAHRKAMQKSLARTRKLLETIEKTIQHLKGKKKMASKEMFTGFRVAAGKDRFDEQITVGQEPSDCKVSGRDTDGAICVFEFAGSHAGPRHVHPDQDEWLYILDGEYEFEVGGKERFRAGPGESVFLPRGVQHAWISTSLKPGKVLNVYQPAGAMEDFFRELGRYGKKGAPPVHEALSFEQLGKLFKDHGLEMVGPPLADEWDVDASGRIVQLA